MENLFLISIVLFTIITQTLSNLIPDCPKERCTSNGQCVDNTSLCPIPMSCPNNFVKINQFTCSLEDDNLHSFSCPDDYFICWEGSCTKNPDNCPSMPTCSASYPIRCPDNSCVYSLDDCPNYTNCPSFLPIRCPSGECRSSFSDCPKITKCPKEFSVLCNDGSCRMTSDECEVPTLQTQCIDSSMSRCSDGTCTNSKFLCPTLMTCPDNYVTCWNGACAKSFDTCAQPFLSQSNSCSNGSLIKCSIDSSCKSDKSLCGTYVICPVEAPVRCWDSSCKENVSKCPDYQECPEGTTRCNDGSCSLSSCGTHITCTSDAPFKCFDNTCRKSPQDCPVAPECPVNSPILCWNGACVSTRADCKSPDSCPITEPVKCPDNMCYKTLDECNATTDCPNGFSKCSDGTCRIDVSDCPNLECPANLPVKCQNGLCVSNVMFCDNANGCPFLNPIRCPDGSCASDRSSCPAKPTCNGKGLRLCKDGSCLASNQPCPLENGCPSYIPFKCADGTCIDPENSTCKIAICPFETPIKCLDGRCVDSFSSCSNRINHDDCGSKYFTCADGTCANSPQECRPIFKCPLGSVRCDDGTCRSSFDLCPLINTCPTARKYRCSDGSCATSKDNCLNVSGCPLNNPVKCPNSGLCVDTVYECDTYDSLFPVANGCGNQNHIKCLSGKCVSDSSLCITNDCPDGKVYCPNSGTCADRLRDCIKFGSNCPENYIRCPKDGKCKPTYEECMNDYQCPINSPFRCIDGSCKRYPYVNSLTNLDLKMSCDIGIQCPDYQPYLCADGSCVEKSSFCQPYSKCEDTESICFDRNCYDSQDQCDHPKKKCPDKLPLLCGFSGKCVSTVYDCHEVSCPAEKPFKCINGLCVTSPSACVVNSLTNSTICKTDEVTCADGSCRKSLDMCRIYPGCTDLNYPFKCPDGSCTAAQSDCLATPTCSSNQTLCEDGVCRQECPPYAGCPNSKPLLCPTGICVNFEYECAGFSNCPIDTPIRCLDGSCAATSKNCNRAKRDFIGTDLQMFISKFKSYKIDMVIGESNDLIGILNIPYKSFDIIDSVNSTFNEKTSSILQIKSVPTSQMRHTRSLINETRASDVYAIFPYSDSYNNLTLEYEYTVLSPAVEIIFYAFDKYKILSPLYISLAYDFPDKNPKILQDLQNISKDSTVSYTLDPLGDVCLARLDPITNFWVCSKMTYVTEANVNYELSGFVDQPGIYAVILNPKPDSKVIDSQTNFLIKYFVIILISGAVSAVVVSVVIYIFVRIYRYRGKYKESQQEAKRYEGKMQEMQMIGTTFVGQTVGDNIENIIYTNNPSFKMKSDEGKTQRMEELEQFHESVLKRYRALEKNNETLKTNFDNLISELNKLKEYKEKLNSGELDSDIKVRVKSDGSDSN